MKNIITLILALFSFNRNPIFSQEEKPTWLVVSQKNYSQKPKLIGVGNSYFYILRDKNKEKYIEKYNVQNLSLVKSKEIELIDEKSKLNAVKFIDIDKHIIILSHRLDKKTKSEKTFYHFFDKESMKINTTKHLTNRSTNTKKIEYIDNLVKFCSSKNGKTALFMFQNDNASKDEMNPNFTCKFINESLDEKNIEITIPFKFYKQREVTLKNNGICYIVIDKLKREETSKNKSVNVFDSKHLVILDTSTGSFKTKEIKIDKNKVFDFKLTFLSNGNIQMTGLTVNNIGVNGTFSKQYNSDMTELGGNSNVFSSEFKKSLFSEKDLKHNKEIDSLPINDYHINHVFEHKNGSITTIVEQSYIETVIYWVTDANGNRHTEKTNHYNCNNIIIYNYDFEGNLNWEKVINKYQWSTVDDTRQSYFPIFHSNYTNLYYINNKEDLVKVKIDLLGKISTSTLSNFYNTEKMVLEPKNCKVVNDQVAFFYASSRKSTQFGTIKL